MHGYDHKSIEKKWQEKWEQEDLYRTHNHVEGRENLFTLVEYPYPSGNLHIGHWYAFSVPDIYARYKRMQGYNVLYPIGFDSFGLPAENAAIKHGKNPKEWTNGNIEYMSRQIRSMGTMFDWSRKVVASESDYYQWTQWLFLQFFQKGLAYRATELANWCPKDLTVLANEQVVGGCCERCGTEVEKREQASWFLRITEYADRLLNDLDKLSWPEDIKQSQRNWIGKTEGAELSFALKVKNDTSSEYEVRVFTTRPDTLYGATYLVLAPEHKLIEALKSSIENWAEVASYRAKAQTTKDIERTAQGREKTGVRLEGVLAVNPATKVEIPVYISDYVLVHYGTGAIMAVPAHDERDFEFAKKYTIPIRQVVAPYSVGIGEYSPRINTNIFTSRAVTAVVKHWSNDTYYVIQFSETDSGLVGGKVEEGETLEEAVRREVLEETGYTTIKNVEMVLEYAFARVYKPRKQREELCADSLFFIELGSENRNTITDQETKNGSWLTEEEILNHTKFSNHHRYLVQLAFHRSPHTGTGLLVNSDQFSGENSEDAKSKITEYVGGTMKSTYRLRDWSLSRQRYWGCPIPIVYDTEGKPHPIPDEHLPWTLPEDVDFAPTGKAPLASSKELFDRTERIFGKGWTPEVDTFDTFVDSSWYFLRYTDPDNNNEFASKDALKSWMPIARYSGGAEHTTMHVLYSRFWHKALYDFGLVFQDEPYLERMNRGQILGPDGKKMSKSKGNVVDPDEHVERVGADTVRMYLAFMGPYNIPGQYPFDLGGIAGMRRFLERVVRLSKKVAGVSIHDSTNLDPNSSKITERDETLLLLNQTIKKVSDDIEQYKFNTALSQIMIFVNHLESEDSISTDSFETLIKLLAPFVPHLTEELWEEMNQSTSVHLASWPQFDAKHLRSNTTTIVIQINGKLRASLSTTFDTPQNSLEAEALALPQIQKWVGESKIRNVIYIPNKVLNFVL